MENWRFSTVGLTQPAHSVLPNYFPAWLVFEIKVFIKMCAVSRQDGRGLRILRIVILGGVQKGHRAVAGIILYCFWCTMSND